MLDLLSRVERCRELAEEYRRVAALCAATEMRTPLFADGRSLPHMAEADEVGTTSLRQPLRQLA